MMEQYIFKLIIFLHYFLYLFYLSDSLSVIGNRLLEENRYLEKNAEWERSTALLQTKCKPCPEGVLCVPQIQCPAHVLMSSHEKPQTCDLIGESFGFCCLTGQNHTVNNGKKERSFIFPSLSDAYINEARNRFATLMHNGAGIAVRRDHPDFLHNIVFQSNIHDDIESFQSSISAIEEVIMSQIFREKENIPVDEFETNQIDVDFDSTILGHHCKPPSLCSTINSKYRTYDGSCNNPLPHRSLWGAAGQPMERLLPPAYEDGVWLPRIHSVDGSLLVGTREISRILFTETNNQHPKYNLLLMQFGQFLAHDITQSASIRLENGEAIECCLPDGSGMLPPHEMHFACMPINIEPQDEFYSHFNQRCMNFVRLSLSPNPDCKISYGKQRSKVTHYIDASPVYGSNLRMANALRTFRGGKLRMFNDFGRNLLPLTNEKGACANNDPGNICFKSGDGRTNQIISLVALHILFAREHNRIAVALSKMNPHLTDEALYQESRRIVIAEFQHIVYNEYLPTVIGLTEMKRFRLLPKRTGFASDYSPDIKAVVTNEFTGAAFRFGHSTVDGKFHLHSNNEVDEVIDIPDVMFNPSRMRKRSFLDSIIKTMLDQPMQEVDSSITHGLSRLLFRGSNPFGLDLAALNIQRGRDHALRTYNDYLKVSGREIIHSFKQFPKNIADKLARVYHHPDDIDLWVGGLLESHISGGLVGPTFGEIIADQFSRLKHGDRHFYEYDQIINPGAFTVAQITEIRKSTLARLLCDNADHVNLFEVSRSAFIRPDFAGNEKLPCDSTRIPKINLEVWKS